MTDRRRTNQQMEMRFLLYRKVTDLWAPASVYWRGLHLIPLVKGVQKSFLTIICFMSRYICNLTITSEHALAKIINSKYTYLLIENSSLSKRRACIDWSIMYTYVYPYLILGHVIIWGHWEGHGLKNNSHAFLSITIRLAFAIKSHNINQLTGRFGKCLQVQVQSCNGPKRMGGRDGLRKEVDYRDTKTWASSKDNVAGVMTEGGGRDRIRKEVGYRDMCVRNFYLHQRTCSLHISWRR